MPVNGGTPKEETDMDIKTASDEVIDAIASIEAHRQDMEREAGRAAACSEALRKLHELLEREREALQVHGPGTLHAVNIEAVTMEIKKVKSLAGVAGQGSGSRSAAPGQRRGSSRKQPPHNPPRNHGRRSMGRRGDS